MNIAEAIERELGSWPQNSLICVGSRSDPYMPLEREYRLTHECLRLLNDHTVPVTIATKSDTEMILADLDLFFL